MDTTGNLGVRLGDDLVHDDQTDQPPDGDRGESAACDEEERTDQVRPIGERDREHGAENRGHQGSDDHGPYDGRRGVRGDAGRGDDRRQHDKDPEPARPLTDVWPFEEHRVAHVLHVVHFCGSRTEIAGAKATVRNVAVPRSGRRPRARSRARP
jgi:hypothetical protein